MTLWVRVTLKENWKKKTPARMLALLMLREVEVGFGFAEEFAGFADVGDATQTVLSALCENFTDGDRA
jgi:hypothetical protein